MAFKLPFCMISSLSNVARGRVHVHNASRRSWILKGVSVNTFSKKAQYASLATPKADVHDDSHADVPPSRVWSNPTMEALLEQVKQMASTADENGRKEIIDALRNLSYAVEGTQDSMQRIMYSEYPLVMARIGIEIGLFDALAKSSSPMTIDQLVERTDTAPLFLNRFLKYLASVRLIEEVGVGEFAANNITKALTIPGYKGGIHHFCHLISPTLKGLPDFLKQRKYTDVTELTGTPFGAAFNTDLPLFRYFPEQAQEHFVHFNRLMEIQRTDMPTWLDKYPYREKVQELTDPDQVFFVDVGGGVGHQCKALRKQLPLSELPNKVILQEQPFLLEQAGAIDAVESMAYDFWTPQPVKGAKIYYMRNVIHMHSDPRAAEILRNLKSAMSRDSVILIDDMVIPNSNAHWQAMQLDLTMMMMLGSIERTRPQFEELLKLAGLKIKGTYKYTESLSDTIIECVPE